MSISIRSSLCAGGALVFVAVALAGCGGGGALESAVPVARARAPFPPPRGEFPVGSILLDVDDPRSAEALAAGLPRVIEAQLWYPAVAGDAEAMPYIARASTLQSMIERAYLDRSATTLVEWSHLDTHAARDALPAVRSGNFPVVLFSPARGFVSATYTSLLQDIASRGFVVIAVEPRVPRAAGIRRTGHDGAAGDAEPLTEDDIERWAGDLSIVLRRFIAATGSVAAIAQRADLTRTGALGHEVGGLVAIAACARETVLRRCTAIDGMPDDALLARGVARPLLVVRSDAPRATDADAARGRWLTLLSQSSATGMVMRIEGLSTLGMTDVPFVAPAVAARFPSHGDAAAGLRTLGGLLGGFFAAGPDPMAAMDSVVARYDDVIVES